MLRRLGIRAKVLAVLALPVLVLLVASAYISVQSVSQARTASAVNRVVQVLPDYAIAIEALQQERTLSMQQVDGDALSGSMAAARKNTDASLIALTEAASALDLSGLDPRVGEAIAAAQNSRSRLSNVREQVDAETIPQALVDSNFTDMITAHNDVPALVAETLSDRSLASRLTAYGQVAGTIERVLRTQPIVLEVLADDGSDPDEVREMAALFAVADEARATARTTTNNLRLNDIQLPSRSADLTAMQIALSNGNQLNISTMDSVRWNTLVNAELNSLRAVSGDLLTSADDRAQTLASAAARESAITIGITIAATALSIVIAFLVSRGIVIPLRRLTSAAGEVREELPRLVEQVAEPGKAPDLSLAEIPVTSQDEVGRLAAAFNSVNATTIQVARDQAALRGSIAEMFVNVARRDQVLLGRQLAFIDSLERSEEDPATLANLFRLDHLATRMRRNAESLLVLAGIDSGRRLREAMPLSDVVRTASSEIEQYDRVQLDLGVDPLMHGFNALAAAHLMAELLENATLFSEPGTPVFVRTDERTGERSGDRQVLVTIVDQGLGMSDEELAEANATIAAAAATDAIGAQRLGLYVVARLATRLGASVTLSRVTDGGSGTVATVAFPGQLFTAEPTAGDGLAAAATGAVPVVEQPEAPVAVPVDLAALTDGATGTGLPRRRTGATAADVPAAPSVVLPAPTAATLSPEITAAPTGWAPAVPAEGGAALPGRGSALPTRGSVLPTRQPARSDGEQETPATPESPTGPRAGLFAGFRGRGALDGAQSASQAGPGGPDTTREELEAAPRPAVDALIAMPSVGEAPVGTPSVEENPVATTSVGESSFVSASIATAPVATDPSATDPSATDLAVTDLAVTDPAVTDPAAMDPVATARAEEQRSAFFVPALMPDDEPVDPSWGEQAAWGEPLAVNSLGEPVLDPMPVADAASMADPRPGTASASASEQGPALEPTPVDEWLGGAPVLADPAGTASTRHELPFAVPEPFAPIGALDSPADPVPTASPDTAFTDTESIDTESTDAASTDTPAAAPVPPVERVELPDFASVVRGDGTDDLPAPRRERGNRTRRPLLSFGRRRRAAEPRAVTGAHKLISPAVGTPAPATPSPVVPVPAAVEEAPAAQGWAPAAAWAPQEEQQRTEVTAPQTDWSAPAPTADDRSWTVTPGSAPFADAEQAPEPAVDQGWAPRSAPDQAWAPQESVWTPAEPVTGSAPAAAPATLPTRVRGEVPAPVEDTPTVPAAAQRRDMSSWASSWSARGGAQAAATPTTTTPTAAVPTTPAPTTIAATTGWAPEQAESDLSAGAFGAQGASTLAMRADIQEQALSELSQLSAYRPKSVDRPAASLVRRTPSAVPEAPEIAPSTSSAPRDAQAVRDRLSSFQSGTRRGRRALADGDTTDLVTPSTGDLMTTAPRQSSATPTPQPSAAVRKEDA